MISVVVVFGLLVGLGSAWAQSDFARLMDVDSKFYTPNVSQSSSSVFPLSRVTRQTAGTNAICVPTGTCISVTNSTNTIDPRIVTGGDVTTSTPAPSTCPFGQVLCTGSAAAVACGQRYVSNIPTTDGNVPYGAYPWQAFIRNQTAYTGSGVLLDALHVLTAAHKVNLNVNTPGNIQVYIGVSDPATTLGQAQMRTAARILLHPNFNADTLLNDIAIIRLSAPVLLGYQTNVGAACLPAATASYIGQRCLVAGWGRTAFTANDAPTSPQKQVTVPIVPFATCRTSMLQPNILGTNTDRFLDPNGELCAGGEANRDACTQDGGAPLLCQDATGRFNIAGLVIWGKNCGQVGVYGVYVDIPKYRAWIDASIATLNIG